MSTDFDCTSSHTVQIFLIVFGVSPAMLFLFAVFMALAVVLKNEK